MRNKEWSSTRQGIIAVEKALTFDRVESRMGLRASLSVLIHQTVSISYLHNNLSNTVQYKSTLSLTSPARVVTIIL